MQTKTHEDIPTEQEILKAFRALTPTKQKALIALLIDNNPAPLLLAHQNIDEIEHLIRVLMP